MDWANNAKEMVAIGTNSRRGSDKTVAGAAGATTIESVETAGASTKSSICTEVAGGTSRVGAGILSEAAGATKIGEKARRLQKQQEREERQRLKALKQQERQEQQEEQRLKNLCSAQQLQWGREWLEQQRLKKEQPAVQKKKDDDARSKKKKNNNKKRKRAEPQKRQEQQRLKRQQEQQKREEKRQRRKQVKMMEAKANVLCGGQPKVCSEDGCSDLQQMCGLCWPHYLLRR